MRRAYFDGCRHDRSPAVRAADHGAHVRRPDWWWTHPLAKRFPRSLFGRVGAGGEARSQGGWLSGWRVSSPGVVRRRQSRNRLMGRSQRGAPSDHGAWVSAAIGDAGPKGRSLRLRKRPCRQPSDLPLPPGVRGLPSRGPDGDQRADRTRDPEPLHNPRLGPPNPRKVVMERRVL